MERMAVERPLCLSAESNHPFFSYVLSLDSTTSIISATVVKILHSSNVSLLEQILDNSSKFCRDELVYLAITNKSQHTMWLLNQTRVIIDVKSRKNNRLLSSSCKQSDWATVALLLEKGSDVCTTSTLIFSIFYYWY